MKVLAARFPPHLHHQALLDGFWSMILFGGVWFALQRYSEFMDGYDQAILVASAIAVLVLGRCWPPLRPLILTSAACALSAVVIYAGSIDRARTNILLKYLLSSQTALLWMCVLFAAALLVHVVRLARGDLTRTFTARLGDALTWSAVVLGFTGLLVRWYESYLLGSDVGHIPISNLYEVFVLFCLVTALFYLYFSARYTASTIGAFVLIVINAAVAFILWYTFERGAHEVQPLVPALQSWWMKIHVPANFVGYGCFALAAMVALAYLVKTRARVGWVAIGLLAIGALFLAVPILLGKKIGSAYWTAFLLGLLGLATVLTVLAERVAVMLPAAEILEEIAYRAITIGFGFFTLATILGALWAAEAWGTYWQWDPKETWALIVWLNYAAWLHLRLVGTAGKPMLAWWALIGLLVTTFAFLGVNVFLSGLHSYGAL